MKECERVSDRLLLSTQTHAHRTRSCNTMNTDREGDAHAVTRRQMYFIDTLLVLFSLYSCGRRRSTTQSTGERETSQHQLNE